MIYHDKINVSEEIDANETNTSKEFDVCHYWHLVNYSFKFQSNFCNRCHNLLMLFVGLSDTVLLSILIIAVLFF